MRSPSESARHVERARILLNYAAGKSVSAIARELRTNRPKVERCIDKGLQLGALSALGDLPRKGRPELLNRHTCILRIDLHLLSNLSSCCVNQLDARRCFCSSFIRLSG